jgi:Ca2+-binding RTX toxin-like protein
MVAGLIGGAASPASAAVITGTPGKDLLVATPEADVIYAQSGNDRITNVGTNDVVWAGSGNDRITLVPFATVSNVTIEANSGHDRITGSANASYVNGDSGVDRIDLDGCDNHIVAGTGNDYLENAVACPGSDTAVVSMGDGHDFAWLVTGHDVLLGNGNDVLEANYVATLRTGSGDDTIDLREGSPENGRSGTVDLGDGNDRLGLWGAGWATVLGGGGNDSVTADHSSGNLINVQWGDDTVIVAAGSVGNALDGGSGRDLARISATASGTTCSNFDRVVDLAGVARTCSAPTASATRVRRG